MDEVTFEDVLTHYHMKLKEACDGVESMKYRLRQAQGALETGWSGAAADACRLKLENVDGELTRALSQLSEAMVGLSAVVPGETAEV